VAALTNQIDNRSMVFSTLKMVNGQFRSLTSAKSAPQQHCKKRAIAFSFQSSGVRELPEFPSLAGSQPITQPYT